MSDDKETSNQDDTLPSEEVLTVCLRCGTQGPVGDDGFCDKCEKALEQACL